MPYLWGDKNQTSLKKDNILNDIKEPGGPAISVNRCYLSQRSNLVDIQTGKQAIHFIKSDNTR